MNAAKRSAVRKARRTRKRTKAARVKEKRSCAALKGWYGRKRMQHWHEMARAFNWPAPRPGEELFEWSDRIKKDNRDYEQGKP